LAVLYGGGESNGRPVTEDDDRPAVFQDKELGNSRARSHNVEAPAPAGAGLP
jgi:hypothetical protein